MYLLTLFAIAFVVPLCVAICLLALLHRFKSNWLTNLISFVVTPAFVARILVDLAPPQLNNLPLWVLLILGFIAALPGCYAGKWFFDHFSDNEG